MARTIIAVFDSMFSAKKALVELEEYGVSGSNIGVFSRPARKIKEGSLNARPKKIQMEVEVGGQRAGMRIGAGIGSAIGLSGSMMVALGALPLPVISGLSFAGPLDGVMFAAAAAAASALAGGLVGLLLGGSLDTGIPDAELHSYARAVRSDEVVVEVIADWDAVDTVVELIHRNSPLRMEERAYSRLRSLRNEDAQSTGLAKGKAISGRQKREDQR